MGLLLFPLLMYSAEILTTENCERNLAEASLRLAIGKVIPPEMPQVESF